MLEDRRDACRALKSLSKDYRLEVGAQGLEILIAELGVDRSDNETLSYALDSLCNVICGTNEDPFEPASPGVSSSDNEEDVGKSFTEIFAKKKENVAILLNLLEEFDFKVRWPALKLLMGLLRHKLRALQDAILAHATGVSRLMDLLSDSREIIRNDAILLLMLLTKGNANIQKIVAFENAFDKILEIVIDEGYTSGGVVVEDCLIVLQNLLKNNTSNQNFFKEGSYIQRLLPFLEISENMEWTSQKTSNVLFFLQVLRCLVSPTNPVQVTNSSQKVLSTCGIFANLCNLLMASGVPPELTTEVINTVAETIRGDHHNQEYFSKVSVPTTPPKTIVSVILMSMIGEKQAFDLRCAVLYCFQCYLYRNELGQAQVIETLLPNSVETSSVTTGQLLVGGLYSGDTLTNWLVSVALSHTLVENKTQKEQLLRVQLATDSSSQALALMSHVCSMMHQGVEFQKRIALLMLLSTWLSNCPLAVSHFLNIPTNVPYLTSQVSLVEGDEQELLIQGVCAFLLGVCIQFNDDSVQSFTREDLLSLITKRAGLQTFLDKLSSISKSPFYSSAAQKPQLKYRKPDDLVFDHEFCNLFKSLEHVLVNAVQSKPNELTNGSGPDREQVKCLTHYQELIRQQDMELQTLRRDIFYYSQENAYLKDQVQELTSTVQQLRDQNSLLRAQSYISNV